MKIRFVSNNRIQAQFFTTTRWLWFAGCLHNVTNEQVETYFLVLHFCIFKKKLKGLSFQPNLHSCKLSFLLFFHFAVKINFAGAKCWNNKRQRWHGGIGGTHQMMMAKYADWQASAWRNVKCCGFVAFQFSKTFFRVWKAEKIRVKLKLDYAN